MSSMLSVSSNPSQRSSRSRSSSVTESTSPDSTSSDSHSSSDPDTHLSSLSPWLQTPSTVGTKTPFGMDVDATSNPHMMDLDSEMSFDGGIHDLQGLNPFQGFNLEDLVLSHTPTNTKSDMLMLEEIIKDGAFDPASTSVQPFLSYPMRSPAFRDFFNPLPPPPLPQDSQPQSQPHPVCIDPSSTQAQPQPTFPTVEQSSPPVQFSPTFKTECAGVLLLSPNAQTVDDASFKHEPPTNSHALPPCDPSPMVTVSSDVVYPPKDACLDLPIFFPSVLPAGTKSRVETQIKLTFELGIPISSLSSSSPSPSSPSLDHPPRTSSSSRLSSSSSSGSNSPNASPVLDSRELSPVEGSTRQRVTHDKVGTYRFLRLPPGTTTKRRLAGSANAKREPKACDADLEGTLQMTADVMCCSPPHALVQSCASCQSREAKRTARKLAARVRPPPSARPKPKSKTGKKSGKKGKEQDFETVDFEEEDDVEEPNVDGSILQFNCAELMDFSTGAVVLPMRITCYCRHHKEKVGFNIVFTLRDHMGRVVGRGITPPILITDDHKSTNAVSKLPPMHPLRQALMPSMPPPAAPSPTNSTEEPQRSSVQEQVGRAPTKRRDIDIGIKKRRPTPYDGRPTSRTVGVGPGIEGRHGVVLALHPAHALVQASAQSAIPASIAPPCPSTDTGASPPPRVSSSPATRSPTPSGPDTSLVSSSSSSNGLFPPQRDVLMSALGSDAAISHHPPRTAESSFQPVVTSPSSSLSPSSISQADHQIPQTLPELQSYSQEHQTMFENPFPIYPSLPFTTDTPSLPKIHRLIPSSGPTTGGIEITVLGSNFHASLPLECVFGGAVASSTHRWSDNTLVCVLPPRATPGFVSVHFKDIKGEGGQDEGGACVFNYVDESDRQLMELALQVVGLKMTGKIEEARNVAMRIVGNTNTQTPTMTAGELTQMNTLSERTYVHHSFLGSLSGMDLETLIIKLLTLLDVPPEDGRSLFPASQAIEHRNATGQTLLHLAVLLALPALVSCLVGRSIDIDARNNNGLTALHFAALTGWKEGAEILLAGGADMNVVDLMGLTAAQRAKNSQFKELEALLEVHVPESPVDGESGEDGDDEAYHSDSEDSNGGGLDAPSPSWSVAPPQYMARSRRMASSNHVDSSPDEFSEPEQAREASAHQSQAIKMEVPQIDPGEMVNEKPVLNEKHDASFVERLQRTLPQGILPNVQIRGLPQLQLPDMLAAPWGALPQIPVFPVFVPIPNLPHLPNWPAFPWPDALSGEKKEGRVDEDTATAGEKQQQPPLAMLWTAYDNFTNNAWRAQWEKWTAQVTALQNANNRGAELPPYSPRSEEKQPQSETQTPIPLTEDEALSPRSGVVATEDTPAASTSRSPVSKATRRVGYGAVKVPEIEVDSYHYRPKKHVNKQDRMLVLFWIPILFLGLAYAIYTTLPMAVAGISRATKRMLPQPLQRDQIQV